MERSHKAVTLFFLIVLTFDTIFAQKWTNACPFGSFLTVFSNVAKKDDNTLVVVWYHAAGTGVIKNTDGGTTWSNVTTNLTAQQQVSYVAYNGSIAGGQFGIIMSTDDGAAWSTIEHS